MQQGDKKGAIKNRKNQIDSNVTKKGECNVPNPMANFSGFLHDGVHGRDLEHLSETAAHLPHRNPFHRFSDDTGNWNSPPSAEMEGARVGSIRQRFRSWKRPIGKKVRRPDEEQY